MARFIVQPHYVADTQLHFTLVYDTEDNNVAYFDGPIPEEIQFLIYQDGHTLFPGITVTWESAQHYQGKFGGIYATAFVDIIKSD